MSSKVAMIVVRLKEAHRLADNVKEHILPKKSIEEMTFEQEDLDTAYQVLDQLMMMNGEVSVGSAIAQVQARIEMAEVALVAEYRKEALVLEREDHVMISLEAYHG